MLRTHAKGSVLFLVAALSLPLLACLAVCVFLFNFWLITPFGNTRYAPGYSEKAFKAVKVGDSEGRVFELLGEPLMRTTVIPDSRDRTDAASDDRRPPIPPASPSQKVETTASKSPHTYLWYSRPAGPSSDSHLQRVIVIQDGRVIEARSEIYLD